MQAVILRERCLGKTLKEIAGNNGWNEKTVAAHWTMVMKALGYNDLASVVRYAVATGIVPNEVPGRLKVRLAA